jgi:hypothetical protein
MFLDFFSLNEEYMSDIGSAHIASANRLKDMSRNNTTPCRLLPPPSSRHRCLLVAFLLPDGLSAWDGLIPVDLKPCSLLMPKWPWLGF